MSNSPFDTTFNIKKKRVIQQLVQENQKMVMTDPEKQLFIQSIFYYKAKVYFEYGSGGSTILTCHIKHLKTIISVESSQPFLDQLMNSSPCLSEANSTGRLIPILANIGKTGELGVPIQPELTSQYKIYPEMIKKYQDMKPDLVLVDGRFRVACALYTLLYAPQAKVLVHDFSGRPHYFLILKYFNVIACVDTMILIEPKKNIDPIELVKDIDQFNSNYA